VHAAEFTQYMAEMVQNSYIDFFIIIFCSQLPIYM